MFLNEYSEKYLQSLLNEAPDDNADMGQTSDNTTYEPQEQDASMGTENDMGEGMDTGMGDDMSMGGDAGGDPSMGGDMGGDASMGGDSSVNTKDLFKKRKLFKDYKDLLNTMDNVQEVAAHMISKNLPEDAKKIYTFLNHKMDENREKITIIMTEQYFNLSYQQLLTIYMYIKMATKLYADMVKQINDSYSDTEK